MGYWDPLNPFLFCPTTQNRWHVYWAKGHRRFPHGPEPVFVESCQNHVCFNREYHHIDWLDDDDDDDDDNDNDDDGDDEDEDDDDDGDDADDDDDDEDEDEDDGDDDGDGGDDDGWRSWKTHRQKFHS